MKSLKTSSQPFNETIKNNNPTLTELIRLYYERSKLKTGSLNHEVEVKFNKINQIDFTHVIQKFKSLNFTSNNEVGSYFIRIYNDFLDPKTGKSKMSNTIRTEINGFHAIQEFCKTNDIQKLLNDDVYRQSVHFVEKTPAFIEKGSERVFIKDVEVPDFQFRVSYRTEKELSWTTDTRVKTIIRDWTKTKKTFRYLNRVTYQREDVPIKVDLSIVKQSSFNNKTYNMDESDLFSLPEKYDIELEIDNSKIGEKTKFNRADLIETSVRSCIKYVLCGLQETNYPISVVEQNQVLENYMVLLHPERENGVGRIVTKDFIGPQSFTLQRENMFNIRKDYVVTEKADGSRCLFYVSGSGKVYFINTNMKVIFTGCKSENKDLYFSLLDGEHILHDKRKNYLNQFASFDIYFVSKRDVRALPFIGEVSGKSLGESLGESSRYSLLKKVISGLQLKSIVPQEILTPLRVSSKDFYPSTKNSSVSIFDACDFIFKKIRDGGFEYETDGLIFTPTLLGVGSDRVGHAGPLHKITWDSSFKWKPAEFNTIDFLVSTVKDAMNPKQDMITPLFEDGLNVNQVEQFNRFKTLVLQVGFDERTHGFLNPCQDVLEDRIPENRPRSEDDINQYKRQRFYPTHPSNPNAGICKVMLSRDENGEWQMKSEEGDVFGDMTIVEFRYDFSREEGWRWVPLRVRYDKTTELKNSLLGHGKPNYGNAYHVADSNWKSIHYPITEEMISTGKLSSNGGEEGYGVEQGQEEQEEVYYNRKGIKTQSTKALRDFHNLFVKKRLILGASKKGDTLIDFACGKGGDFPKWIAAGLSFVFGVDVVKDNLENRLDGACARYLSNRKKNTKMPFALFVHGDSSKNIRDGSALMNDKAVQITRAVFGEGPKDNHLGAGVERQYGVGIEGFNVSSCQFALHYFAENLDKFRAFIRNVAECTKLNGYFIGTCYDGQKVFDLLRDKEKGDGEEIVHEGVKIWEIKKEYSANEFLDDSSSLGYKIEVYQESINKMIPEYLVNFEYFVRVMNHYGFKVIGREEAKRMGLPEGSGLFRDLFTLMMDGKPRLEEFGDARHLHDFEKKISFLNRYFVFQKVRQVNLNKIILEDIRDEKNILDDEIPEDTKPEDTKPEDTKPEDIKKKRIVKKLNSQLVLNDEPKTDKGTRKKRNLVLVEEDKEPIALVPPKESIKKQTRKKKLVLVE